MKVLVSSDWHADARTIGHARFGDVDQAVRQMVEDAITHKVDCFCFLGDLCDPDSGSTVFRSVELAISAATELSKAQIPTIWLAGNHDVIEDGTGDTTLSPLRPLQKVAGMTMLFERPGYVELGGVRFVLLPYTALSHTYDPEEVVRNAVWSTAGTIVLAHLSVAGVEPGEETNEMPRGRDVLFPRRMFSDQMESVHCFNGHYHRQQTHELPGFRPVHIPGAPCRFTFGEESNRPGYLLVEV